jgi:hypothetical protein
MAAETEIKKELQGERAQLTAAVESLREEIGTAKERGKKIGAAVGAAMGVATAVRIVLSLRKRD